MNRALIAAFVVLAFFLSSGCSVLETIERQPMTAELITNQLTLRFIAGADDPVERAAKLRATVAKIKGGLDKEYSLVQLDEAVRAEIDWQDYSIADQELLNFALTKARQAIGDLVGEGAIDPDDQASIDSLFRWVDQAAARVR